MPNSANYVTAVISPSSTLYSIVRLGSRHLIWTGLRAFASEGKGQTAFVENANLTLRQLIAPLYCRTWSIAYDRKHPALHYPFGTGLLSFLPSAPILDHSHSRTQQTSPAHLCHGCQSGSQSLVGAGSPTTSSLGRSLVGLFSGYSRLSINEILQQNGSPPACSLPEVLVLKIFNSHR